MVIWRRGPPEHPGRSLSSLRYHGHELKPTRRPRRTPGSVAGQEPRLYPVMAVDHRDGAVRRLPPCRDAAGQDIPGRAQSGEAPPCMRWRGLARPRRTSWPVAWRCRTAHRPPGPGTRARDRSPGSFHVPGVAPKWCPFPNGDNISTASAGTAQEPAASHFTFFRYSQRNPRETGSFPHSAAVIHRLAHSMSTGSRVWAGEHRNGRHRMPGVM